MDKIGLEFGLVIAYLIPGFLGLYALAGRVEAIKALVGGEQKVPQAASIIPLILLALAVGITINATSWALLRPLIGLSGVKRPARLDYTKIKPEQIPLYNLIVESNFRYHQFYGNVLVAIIMLAPVWLASPLATNVLRNLSFFFVVVILFLAARDSLQRAYKRMLALQTKEKTIMTNGEPGPGDGHKPKQPPPKEITKQEQKKEKKAEQK